SDCAITSESRLDLHSCPTRRSSDLEAALVLAAHALVVDELLEGGRGGHAVAKGGEHDGADLGGDVDADLVEQGDGADGEAPLLRSEEHTSELQSRENLVCRLPLEKK